MRLRNPLHRVSAAAGLAAGGVLVGHGLTYAIVQPDRPARDHLLAATGHGYLPAMNVLALLAVLITLGSLFLGRLTRPWSTPNARQLAGRIAAFQVGAFLAMEVLERLSSGAPVSAFVRGELLPIGVVSQVAVAAAVTLVVRILLRVSDRVAAVLGGSPRMPAGSSTVLRARAGVPFNQPDILLAFGRGPPLPE
jgi:hypothetical protein